MKITKSLALVLIGLTLAFTSCKKDKKDNGGTSNLNNAWKIGNTLFNNLAMFGEFEEGLYHYSALGGDEFGLVAFFKTKPTAGTYKVVFKTDESTLLAGEVLVAATEIKDGLDYSTYAESGTVTVKINNGLTQIILPKTSAFTVKEDNFSTKTSTTLEANVTETAR